MHAHTHTHTHTRMHIHTHTNPHSLSLTHSHTLPLSHTLTHAHSLTHTYSQYEGASHVRWTRIKPCGGKIWAVNGSHCCQQWRLLSGKKPCMCIDHLLYLHVAVTAPIFIMGASNTPNFVYAYLSTVVLEIIAR